MHWVNFKSEKPTTWQLLKCFRLVINHFKSKSQIKQMQNCIMLIMSHFKEAKVKQESLKLLGQFKRRDVSNKGTSNLNPRNSNRTASLLRRERERRQRVSHPLVQQHQTKRVHSTPGPDLRGPPNTVQIYNQLKALTRSRYATFNTNEVDIFSPFLFRGFIARTALICDTL